MALIKNLALVTNDYQFMLSDGNGGVIGGPTYEKLQTANICEALTAYLLNIPEISGFFNNEVYPYNREDQANRTTPSIDLFAGKVSYDGTMGWMTMELNVNVYMPLANKREVASEALGRWLDYLSLILNGDNCIYFMLQYCNGLVSVAFNNDWDYSNSIAADGNGKLDINIARATGESRVAMLDYYIGRENGDTYLESNVRVTPV